MSPAKTWDVDLPSACDLLPGTPAASLGCAAVREGADAAADATKDAALGAAGDALESMVAELAKAGAHFVEYVAEAVLNVTAPQLDAGWFTDVYASMWYVASLIVTLLLLVGAGVAGVRRDGAGLAHTISGTVGAFIAAGVAPWVVKGLVAMVDVMSAHVAASVSTDVEKFLTRIGKILATASAGGAGIPALAAAIGLLAVIAGAFFVFVELLMRTVGIEVLLALGPAVFAFMVIRGGTAMVKKAALVMIALIASKLVIVVVITLGMAGLAGAGTKGDSFVGLLSAGALMLLAAFALPAVLRVIPDMDGSGSIASRAEIGRAAGADKARASTRAIGSAVSKGQGSGAPAKTGAAAGGAKGGAAAAGGTAAAGAATAGAALVVAGAAKGAQATKDRATSAGTTGYAGGQGSAAQGASSRAHAPRHAKPTSGPSNGQGS